jgi:hypothetical protein
METIFRTGSLEAAGKGAVATVCRVRKIPTGQRG